MKQTIHKYRKIGIILACATALPACSAADRIAQIGSPPPLSRIKNPVEHVGYKPVRLPMPEVKPVIHQANSLWRSGARAFFDDQRAKEIGDILTVKVDITDKAKIANTTTQTRAGTENTAITKLAGVASKIAKIAGGIPLLGLDIDPTNLVDTNSNSSYTGNGTVDRAEELEVSVAAIVTQILPNGNMVLEGKQEVRVNNEIRVMVVAGIIRPEDISATNTVDSAQMAEARISYGGRGPLTQVQAPRYGQQFFDIILPF